jgi:hypothetical protein
MSSTNNLPAPTVPSFPVQLLTSFGQKVGTGLAVLLAGHGWLAPADQATAASQIGAILVGVVSIAWTVFRDHAQVQNSKALAVSPPIAVK